MRDNFRKNNTWSAESALYSLQSIKVNFVVAKQHADNNRQTFKHVKGLLVKVLTRVRTLT